MYRHKLIIAQILILLAFVAVREQALAHPMPNTIVHLSVSDQSISGTAKMPYVVFLDATKHPEDQITSPLVLEYFHQHITAYSENKKWKTVIRKYEIVEEYDQEVGNYSELEVSFELIPPNQEDLRQFNFAYDAIIHEVLTHKILVYLQYDWNEGLISDDVTRPIGVIETDFDLGKSQPLKIDLNNGSWMLGTWAMFLYGMEHIRFGFDHVLFLLTLLLVAPLAMENNRWTSFQGLKFTLLKFLKISLAFTLGHSVTLLAGSFELIQFQPQYIEVLIVVSIIISAVHCIKPIFSQKEPLIAAGFGLIHGLAFSTSLSTMNLGWQARILSVLGFNLGIESMQLAIMLLVFPFLLLSKFKAYDFLRIAFAIVTLGLSIVWLNERLLFVVS